MAAALLPGDTTIAVAVVAAALFIIVTIIGVTLFVCESVSSAVKHPVVQPMRGTLAVSISLACALRALGLLLAVGGLLDNGECVLVDLLRIDAGICREQATTTWSVLVADSTLNVCVLWYDVS